MGRRGEPLRDHILQAAKRVFLERGFERASMDEVAARAQTSKRTLYAHFKSKQQLFFAVIEMVRRLALAHLKPPATYSARPADALARYLASYLAVMRLAPAVQMMRITIAEAERFPRAAEQHHDALFGLAATQLAAYLAATFALSPRASADAAQRLLAQVLFPVLPRALFGLDDPRRAIRPRELRRAVAGVIASLDI